MFNPAELALLQQVFDEACQAFHILPGSEQAESIAHDTMLAYARGITDKDLLLAAVFPARSKRKLERSVDAEF